MPELPEVHTTVSGLNDVLPNLKITDFWSDWFKTVKNQSNLKKFKDQIVGQKVLRAERRGKNILIHLTNKKTILIHMKMTGHLLYGKWEMKKTEKGHEWLSTYSKPLEDPFNRFIHNLFFFSNGKQLALSDMRKFAKILLLSTDDFIHHPDLINLGPEPLEKNFSFDIFKKNLEKKPQGKIKTVLMDQNIISGVGNIYSDEILWDTGIHPEERVKNISPKNLQKIFTSLKKILKRSIAHGGDSMSDYRNVYGERGGFQKLHKAYRKTGEKCSRKGCAGVITRIKVGGRSAHFCDKHQKLVGRKQNI